ncbi:MAG TPA: TRAP transporter large permease subunit, partial [Burkholderiaceae bacterium]|nr:TRAP transporter large permease subunit [Burkholderiaceae bacterium]
MRKEVWFGLSILAAVIVSLFVLMPSPENITNGHLGLLMLGLIVVAIMLGFPTAFTLMGMGVIFAWLAYRNMGMETAIAQTLDLMVLRTYAVMTNDVLIAIPLFIFMGYLVERANLIEKLFKSLHLAMARIPGSLAVATVITCAVFATATGIVGAVVTLMGLLALPAMLKAGYSVRLSAGAITAGGCLGILIPPSVLLIVYGAVAGVSVVKLYAGAFFPGLMLAGLYVVYIVIVAKLNPASAPPLSAEERRVTLPEFAELIKNTISNRVLPGLIGAMKGKRNAGVPLRTLVGQLFTALLPGLAFVCVMGLSYNIVTQPAQESASGLMEMGFAHDSSKDASSNDGLQSAEGGLAEPEVEGEQLASDTPLKAVNDEAETTAAAPEALQRISAPTGYWIAFAIGLAGLVLFYAIFTFARLEIFKMLLSSFFPLAIMILAVLGS